VDALASNRSIVLVGPNTRAGLSGGRTTDPVSTNLVSRGFGGSDVGETEQVFVARPTGVGRAITTYDMPIEGRDEWVAAARRLA